jgi:hypothetical protein
MSEIFITFTSKEDADDSGEGDDDIDDDEAVEEAIEEEVQKEDTEDGKESGHDDDSAGVGDGYDEDEPSGGKCKYCISISVLE